MRFRHDPGDCLVCGAAHCACGGAGEPITVVQLPARDAAELAAARDALTVEVRPGVFVAKTSTSIFGDGTDGRPFTTATYRGIKKPRA